MTVHVGGQMVAHIEVGGGGGGGGGGGWLALNSTS